MIPNKHRASHLLRAFSLLEVMVALALASISIVLLIQVQVRSITLAQEARVMTIATQLLRAKMYDCQDLLLKNGFSVGDMNESGKFDEEGHQEFSWECHAYKPDIPVAEPGDIAESAGALGANDAASSAASSGSSMAAGMMAPVISQVSQVISESIRELVVIVYTGEGENRYEQKVTTHIVDRAKITAMAQGIAASTGALGGLSGPSPTGSPGLSGGSKNQGSSQGVGSGRPSPFNPTGGIFGHSSSTQGNNK